MDGAKRVIVIVEGSTPPVANEKGIIPREGGLSVQKEASYAIAKESIEEGDEKMSTKPSEIINDNKTNVPPTELHTIQQTKDAKTLLHNDRLEAALAAPITNAIVKKTKSTNASGTVVKKGAVQKRVKASPKPLKGASNEACITAVKVDPLIQELRAQRNKPHGEGKPSEFPRAATDTNPSDVLLQNEGARAPQTQGNVNDIHEEISKLLLDYCWSGAAPEKADGSMEHQALLTNNKSPLENAPEGNGLPPKEEANVKAGATSEDVNAERNNPEMLLYNRVIQLCQRDDITPTILEVLYELIKHTRVIKFPPASTAGRGGDPDPEVPSPDASNSARDNVKLKQRQYAQQVILVLINQIRQQRLNTEYRQQLLHDQKQLAAGKCGGGVGLVAHGLSSLASPFSGSIPHNQPQKTLFITQGENRGGSSLNPAAAAFWIPPTALSTFVGQATWANLTTPPPCAPQTTPMNPYATPFVAKCTPPKTTDTAPPIPCTFPLNENLVSLLENFKERLLSWTAAVPPATVNITSQERQTLIGMQESFKRAIVGVTSPSPRQPPSAAEEKVSLKSGTNSKHNTWSFVAFDSGDEMNPTAVNVHPWQGILRGDNVGVNLPQFSDSDAQAKPRYPPGLHRTVFTYKTVQVSSTDENSPSVWSHSENNTLMDSHPALAPNNHPNVALSGPKSGLQFEHDAQKDLAAQSSFNFNAKPFIPCGRNDQAIHVMKGMNVNAPSFTPASLATTNSSNMV
ncbi:unnamed protein product [Phytomonas sp. Hart1]|nr:unnamed protein product [Phytomonas sp. Hart1]|eukprot:CCW66696.1 unnamed protein product [Phytomonas sp. isolate Hart1]